MIILIVISLYLNIIFHCILIIFAVLLGFHIFLSMIFLLIYYIIVFVISVHHLYQFTITYIILIKTLLSSFVPSLKLMYIKSFDVFYCILMIFH